MPIEIRHGDRIQPPQSTREKPGLRFTDTNFSSTTMAAGFASITELYPREGFMAWDGDMIVYSITGCLAVEEEGGARNLVHPGNSVYIPAGTRYRWHQMDNEATLVFVVNPLPFNPL